MRKFGNPFGRRTLRGDRVVNCIGETTLEKKNYSERLILPKPDAERVSVFVRAQLVIADKVRG